MLRLNAVLGRCCVSYLEVSKVFLDFWLSFDDVCLLVCLEHCLSLTIICDTEFILACCFTWQTQSAMLNLNLIGTSVQSYTGLKIAILQWLEGLSLQQCTHWCAILWCLGSTAYSQSLTTYSDTHTPSLPFSCDWLLREHCLAFFLIMHIKFRFINTAWFLNWSTVYWHFSLIDRVCMMNCGLCSKMILASSWLLSFTRIVRDHERSHFKPWSALFDFLSHAVICELCRGGSHGNCLLIKSISWVTLARAESSGPSS